MNEEQQVKLEVVRQNDMKNGQKGWGNKTKINGWCYAFRHKRGCLGCCPATELHINQFEMF